MKIIQQTNSTNCGQTCLAMILDIPLEDSIKLVGHDGITSENEILKHLIKINPDILTTERNGNIKKPVKNRLYICLHMNPKKFKQKHWTIFYDGVIIDPAMIDKDKLWPIYKHWVVK